MSQGILRILRWLRILRILNLAKGVQIEFTKVGRHRRVPFAALVEYKRHADQPARAAADEMPELGQELGL